MFMRHRDNKLSVPVPNGIFSPRSAGMCCLNFAFPRSSSQLTT